MSDLSGKVGELSFTVQVTRKDTGVTEEVTLIGVIDEEQRRQLEEAGIIHPQPKE